MKDETQNLYKKITFERTDAVVDAFYSSCGAAVGV